MTVPNAVAPSDRPIRCLVIQFARLGDTLQSLMALRAAKQLYPNLEIHFAARARFSAAAKRVPWIKEVIELPTDAILGPVLRQEKSEVQALGDVARWIAPLVKQPWDLVVNWSYSESSSFLTGLMPARVKLGFTRRKDTSFAASDGWSHYIQGVVQSDVGQNVHLTDILTTQLLTALQIHFGEPANEGNAPVTSKSFFSLELQENENGWCWRDFSRKWVAIQLGASTKEKTWPLERWKALSAMVLKANPEYNVVLLGGKEDQQQAREFVAAMGSENTRRVLSLVGETDFDLWASVVSGCQWLVAGDTAAIHLASVLGTRVLNISVGPVRFAETGPYGNGHYVISGSDITPESVYAAWTYATNEWAHRRQYTVEAHFEKLGWPGWKDAMAKVQLFRSRIRGTQDGGGVIYEPLIARAASVDEWLSMVLGHIARAWYCGWVPPVGQDLVRSRISPALVQKLREIDESAKILNQIYGEAILTSLSLNKKSAKLKSERLMPISDRQEIQDLGAKLKDLDGLAERLATTQPSLRVFNQMATVLMHNLHGDQISDLGRESASSYRQLNDGVAILRDWLIHTLQLAKPVALSRNAGAGSDKEQGL